MYGRFITLESLIVFLDIKKTGNFFVFRLVINFM